MASVSDVTVGEGPILTIDEAVDGTLITGTIEAGDTVQITFTNGAHSVTLDADVNGTSFSLDLTPSELEQLGEGYISFKATATDAFNGTAESPTGVFLYTLQPFVDATDRLDGPGTYAPQAEDEDSGLVGTVALAGGGFAVQWVVDTNGDGDGDTFAIQRYDAAGAKVGDVVLLQDLPEVLGDGPDGGSDVTSIDLASLENGGYALTYKVDLAETDRSLQATAASSAPIGVVIAGRPVEIDIASAPGGATYTLQGIKNGVSFSVLLTVVDGDIDIPQELLSQFDFQDRFTLQIGGVAQGQQVSLSIGGLQTRLYDTDSVPQSEARSLTVGAGGSINLTAPDGRAESFDIDAITPAGANATYVMVIAPAMGPQSINIAGIAGAFVSPTGIIITGLVPDGNGIITVPQAILDQLGDNDASIILNISGLAVGSTLSGSILVRDAIEQIEGVFVMTFDANGVPVAQPDRLDGPGFYAPSTVDDDGGMATVIPLAGGGFAVQWIANTDTTDTDGDTFAIQRYDAAGAKVGDVVLLQDLPEVLGDGPDGGSDVTSIDLASLENGGYALTYKVDLAETDRSLQATAASSAPIGVVIAGRPVEIDIASAPGGATYTLQGIKNGVSFSVLLTVVDGDIDIPQELLSQFDFQDRFTLQIGGVAQGQQVSLSIGGLQTRLYDTDSVPQSEARSLTVGAGGSINLTAPDGRAESFDIDAITPAGANATYVMVIAPAMGPQSINIAGIAGAFVSPTGIIITGLVPDGNGIITVPQAILDQLGDNDASIILNISGLAVGSTLSGSILVRDAIEQIEGVFVMTFDANGVPVAQPDRLDGPGFYAPSTVDDDGGMATVIPLAGGGFAVQWIANTDTTDTDGDTFAIQRYDAAGAKVGDVVLLQDLPEVLGDGPDGGSDVTSIDLASLENGGYALTYELGLADTEHFIQATGPAQGPISILIAGRPTEIDVNVAPVGATFTLQGTKNGGAFSIPLTVVDGVIDISQESLGQFDYQDRFTLLIGGVAQGQQVNLSLDELQTRLYDPDSVLQSEARSLTIGASGGIALVALDGRAESFDIDAITPVGANATYVMVIAPALGTQSINIAGMQGVFVSPTGIIVTGLVPDVNGVIAVPQAILDQLGDNDATIILSVGGLVVGSSLTGNVLVREAIHQPEGVFVMTFDANGVPVTHELNLAGTAGADFLVGDVGNDILNGGTGADSIAGGAGNDTLRGGVGDDHLLGGADNDLINGNDGFDLIEGGDGDDELRGNFNADTMSGGDGNDSIFGGNGHDVIDGGNGNDTIVGALGHDSLTGGAGADVFVYQTFQETRAGGIYDKILDFTTGQDKIDLTQLDANSNAGGDQAFSFIGVATFSNSAGQLRSYDSGVGSWYVEGDINGDGLADFRFEVFTPANPATALTSTDFFL